MQKYSIMRIDCLVYTLNFYSVYPNKIQLSVFLLVVRKRKNEGEVKERKN